MKCRTRIVGALPLLLERRPLSRHEVTHIDAARLNGNRAPIVIDAPGTAEPCVKVQITERRSASDLLPEIAHAR